MTSNALALAQKVSVLTSSSGASTTTYANSTELPTSGVTTGEMAYVSGTNKLYMWNGTAWFNIAIVNQAPTAITGSLATYVLATDGTPTVVTLVSTDPEGLPLTWSSSTSGDTQVGTVTNTDNVFTITPSTDEADIGTLSVTFSVTDGNNTETSVSSFTLEFVSAYWNETVLSIGTSSTNGLANNTFIDRSTNAHTVTPAGTPVQTAFHPYLNKWGVEFTEDTVTIPTSAEFNVGNGNFTFETWINTTRNGGTIFDFGGNYLVTYNGFRLEFASTGYLSMRINQQSYSASGEYTLTGSTKMNDGKWNHIRITRTGTTFRFFVNGVLDVSGTSSVTGYQAGSAFVIGGALYDNTPASALTGYLSNFRLIKGTSLNTTNDSFDVPTENLTNISGTSLLLFNRNRFIDLSSTGHSLTSNGAKVSAFNPFGQGSEYAVGENKGSTYFDGSGDYLRVPYDVGFELSSSNFTIECWVYPTVLAGDITVLATHTSDPTGGYAVGFNETLTRTWLNFSGDWLQVAGPAVSLNTWNHIAVVRDGSSFYMYTNGVRGTVFTNGGAVTSTANSDVTIGARYNGTSNYYTGYVSNVRIVKGTALYTTNFTPPTAPVGSANASLYLPMDNAGIFDKTGNNTLTPVGNASTSTTQTKFADTAMYFDGTGDYISIPNVADIGLLDFTIELWLYSVAGNDVGILETRTQGATNGFTLTTLDDDTIRIFSGSSLIASSGTSYRNQWIHIAVVRSSGTTQLFLGGQSVGTTTSTINMTNGTMLVGAGIYSVSANPSAFMTGYIENLQILKGVAKYTANFTVPNRTQGRTYQQT